MKLYTPVVLGGVTVSMNDWFADDDNRAPQFSFSPVTYGVSSDDGNVVRLEGVGAIHGLPHNFSADGEFFGAPFDYDLRLLARGDTRLQPGSLHRGCVLA